MSRGEHANDHGNGPRNDHSGQSDDEGIHHVRLQEARDRLIVLQRPSEVTVKDILQPYEVADDGGLIKSV